MSRSPPFDTPLFAQFLLTRETWSILLANRSRFVPKFYNFWTSLTSNLNFWTNYDAKGAKSQTFIVVGSSVKVGFCGQTLPPAADKLWEKSHCLLLLYSYFPA